MLPMRQNLESNVMGITYQDKIIDFGTVIIGSTTIQETLIKNERGTSTDLTIKSYKSSNSLYQSFNIWPTKFTLRPGEFKKVTISFTPARPYMVYIDYFYIFDSFGLHTSLTVKGETIGPYILSTKNEIMIITSQDEVKKKSFDLKNFSEVPTMYQFEVDNENSVFRIHPRSSVIEGNGTVSITVEFWPINKGSFEKRIVCMIEHQCPILIRVIGLNGSFLGGVCPELLRCPVLSTNIFGYNDYQSYLCSDLDQVIDIKPKYSLKFMEGSIYERLAVTNLTHLPMTLVWGAESLRAFRVTPTWHALTPGVTVYFVVQYIWNKVNYRDCHKMCDDLREDGLDNELRHSIVTSDLDGWIYWEKKGICLNMPHDPWNFAQEYYDDKWESTKIPLNVTVKLIGQNLEKKTAFEVDCDVFPSTLIFPTSCDHQPVYTSLQIKNLTRTPVMYQLLPPENSDITAKPMEGVINEELQIVVLKLTPKIKGSSSYLENWVIRFNGSEYDQKSLILAGICESFGIRIGDNNQVTFSPSQLGCSTEEVVTIWNKSSYWIKLSCCSEKIPSILNIGACEHFLAPNELLEQQWIFRPTATGNYSVFIHYDAVIVQVPRIAALNKLAKQYFGGLIVQHEDIVIPTCKRSEPLKLPYPYPYSLIELDEFLSSHNRRSYDISVNMKCLDDTVMAQPKVMHLTDFILSRPASSSFILSNLGESCIPYSLVLLHEPDNIITTDPQDHRLENYARKEVDEYHYEIRPNKGMLWPNSSIRVLYTICSKILKPQSYSVQMEVIQSNCEINSDSKKDVLVKPRKVCFIHCDGKWPEVKITALDSSKKDCIFNKFTLWKALNISGLNKVIKFNTPPKRTTFNLKFPERPFSSPPITYSFRLENFSPVPIEWEMLIVSNFSEEKAGFCPRSKTAAKMFGSLRSILIRRRYPPSSCIEIKPTKGLIMPRAEEIIKMTVYFDLEGSYTFQYRLSFKMMMLGIKEDIPENSDGLSILSFSECNVIYSEEEDGTKNDNPCNAYFTNISAKNSAMDLDKTLHEESVTNDSNISQSKYTPNKTLILPMSKDDEDKFSRKYLSINSNDTKPDVLQHSKLIFKPKMTKLTKPQIILSRPWKALWVGLATSNEDLSQQESMAQECKQPKLKDGSPPELIERVSTTFKDFVVSLSDLLEKPEEPVTYTREQSEKFDNEILTSEFMDLIKKQQQELDTIEHSVSSSVKCKKILSTPCSSISNDFEYSSRVEEIRSKSEPCMSFLMTEQQYEDYDMLSENELYSVSLSNLPSLPEIKEGFFSEDVSEEELSLKCQSLPCVSVSKAADNLSFTKKMRSTSEPCTNILMTGEERSVFLDNNSSKSSNELNLVTLNNLPSIPEIDEDSVSLNEETNISISHKPDMVSSCDSQTCYKSSVLFKKEEKPLKFQKSFPTSALMSKAGQHSLNIKKIIDTSKPSMRCMTSQVHSMVEDDNTSSSSNEPNLVKLNTRTSIPGNDKDSVSSQQESNMSMSQKPDIVSSSVNQHHYKSTAQKSLGMREQQNKSDISLLGQKSSDAGKRISESRHNSHNIIGADALPLRSTSNKSSPIIKKQSSISSEKQSIIKKYISSIKEISQKEHLKKYLILPENSQSISIDESISSLSDSDLDSNELFEAEKSHFRTLPVLCPSSSTSETKMDPSGHRKSSTTTGCIKKLEVTLPSIQESAIHKSSKNIPIKHQSYAQKIPKNLVMSQNKLHYEDSLSFIKTDKGLLPNEGKELFTPDPEDDKSGTLSIYKALKKKKLSLISSLKSSKGKIVVVAKDSHSQRSAPDSSLTGSSACKLQKKIKTSNPNYPHVPFESQRPFKCTDQSGSVVISHRCLDVLGYGIPDVDVKSIPTNKIVSTKKPITKLLPQPAEIIKIRPYPKSSNKKDITVSKGAISSKNTVRVRFAEDVKSASVTNNPRINKSSVGIKSNISCKSAKSAIATNTSIKSIKGSEDTNVMIISPRSKGSKDILGTKRSKETKKNEGIEESRGLKGKRNIKDTKPNVTTKGTNCKKDLKGSKGRKNKKGAKNNKEIKDTKEMKAEESIDEEDTKFKCIMGCEGVKDIKDIVGIKDNKYIRGASVMTAMRGIKLIEETKDVAGIESMKTTTAAGSIEGINSIRESICKSVGKKSLHSKKIARVPESGSRTDVREEVRHREYANVAIIEESFDSDSVSESNSSVTLEGKIKIQSSVESEEEDNGKSISESLEEIELSSIIAPTEKVSSRELGEIMPKSSVATKIIDKGFVSESSEEIELSSTIASTEKLSSHKLGEIMPKPSVATKMKSTEVCPEKKQRSSVDDSKRKDLILVTPENARRAFSLPTGEKLSPSSCRVSECNLKREFSMLSIPVLKEQPSYSNVSLPLLELYKALEGKNIEECLKVLRQMQNSVQGDRIYYVSEVQSLSDDSCTSTNLSPSSDSETRVPNLLESQEISTSSAHNKNMEQNKAGSREIFSTSIPFRSKSHSGRSKIDPKDVKKYNYESSRLRLEKSTISEVGSKKDKIKLVDKMKTSLSKTKAQSLEDSVNSDGSCCIGPFASHEAGNNEYLDESENFKQKEILISKNYSLSDALSDLVNEHNSDEYGNNGKESSVSELNYNSFQKPPKNKIISSFMRLIQPNYPVELRKKKLWDEPKDPIAVNVDLEMTVMTYDYCHETASIFPRLHSNTIKMKDVCIGNSYSPLQVVWLFNPQRWKGSKYVIENMEMSQREENDEVFECLNPRGVIKPRCLYPLLFRFDPTESRLYKTTMLIGFKELKKQICIEGRGVEHVPQTFKTIQPSYPVHNIKENPDFPVNLSDEVLVISKPIPGHCKAMRLIYLVNSSERTMRFNWKIMAQHDFLNNLVDVNVQPSHGYLLPSQILPFIVSFSKASKKKLFHVSKRCPHAKGQTSEFNSLNIHADNQPVKFSNMKKNSPIRSTNEKLERKVNISSSNQTEKSSETTSDKNVSLDSVFQSLEHEVAMMDLFTQDEENEEIDDDIFNTGFIDFDSCEPKEKDNDCWKSPERAYDQEGKQMTMYALSVPEVEKHVTGTQEKDKQSKILRRALAESETSLSCDEEERTDNTLNSEPTRAISTPIIRKINSSLKNTERHNRNGKNAYGFDITGKRQPGKRSKGVCYAEIIDAIDNSCYKSGERVCFVHKLAIDSKESSKSGKIVQFTPEVEDTLESLMKGEKDVRFVPKIDTSLETFKVRFGTEVENSFGSPKKSRKHVHFAKEVENSFSASEKSGKHVHFAKEVENSFSTSKKSGKHVHFAKEVENSFGSHKKSGKHVHFANEVENSLDSCKKSMKGKHFCPKVETLQSILKSKKQVRFETEFSGSHLLKSCMKSIKKVHFAPDVVDALETSKKDRKKVHFAKEVENSISVTKKSGKHVHFAKEVKNSLDSCKKSMKNKNFCPKVETLKSILKSKKQVRFETEFSGSHLLKSCMKSIKKVHFAPDVVDALETSKKDRKKVHFAKEIDDLVEPSQTSRKGGRFSSVKVIDYLGSSDEEESDTDENLWDFKSCQCNDSSLLVDWFPLACELTETKLCSSSSMEKEEKVCKPFNISGTMYNEEELEVPYKERLTWPPNDELLCLNTEQIPKFDDLPILPGRNVEWIIHDVLEGILWNLLHSEWFRVMRTKISMEHTVKDWRMQKINAELQEHIHPSPNDEVPFYSQIVTADKPLFNQIYHGGEETCTLDSKPSTSKGPSKKPSSQLEFDSVHVCKEKDILDFKLQKNAYVCDDNLEMNSEERPNKILPYAIPRIVVSTIFEDIISELTLTTLTDFFEPAYDIKRPFQDYDNENDSQFNDD